jgi:hypothetical protein
MAHLLFWGESVYVRKSRHDPDFKKSRYDPDVTKSHYDPDVTKGRYDPDVTKSLDGWQIDNKFINANKNIRA